MKVAKQVFYTVLLSVALVSCAPKEASIARAGRAVTVKPASVPPNLAGQVKSYSELQGIWSTECTYDYDGSIYVLELQTSGGSVSHREFIYSTMDACINYDPETPPTRYWELHSVAKSASGGYPLVEGSKAAGEIMLAADGKSLSYDGDKYVRIVTQF